MEPMISICCTAYNHEKYIAEAIESLLMQKTSYPFEILVHDDASTDNTAKVIKKYEKDFPELIKPIYQTENQYSKNNHVGYFFNTLRAKGKYMAICEGDDYWTDPLKLQKQVDYLEANPQCSLCTHAARRIARDKKVVGYIKHGNNDQNFTTVDVIRHGGGGLFATNSMVYPRKLVQNMPDFYHHSPVGDFPLMLYLSLQGDMHYMAQCMSDYRVATENSWTSRLNADKNNVGEHIGKIGIMLDEFNEYTGRRYEAEIRKCMLNREFTWLLSIFAIEKIKLEKYKENYESLSIKQKMRLYLGAYLPSVLELSAKIRKIHKA